MGYGKPLQRHERCLIHGCLQVTGGMLVVFYVLQLTMHRSRHRGGEIYLRWALEPSFNPMAKSASSDFPAYEYTDCILLVARQMAGRGLAS